MIETVAFSHHLAAASSLSPAQRWQAARSFTRNFGGEDGFILLCSVVLAVLVLLFVIVTILGSLKKRKNSNRLFIDYADKHGLNIRERHILMDIALRARLRLIESIFTMPDVFDRGATRMIRLSLANEAAKRSRYLTAELSVLREKLGFHTRRIVSSSDSIQNKPGSRQIPEGRKLYITSVDTSKFFEVEALVIENNELQLVIRPSQKLECEPGEKLYARCYFGAPIWEFDTSVLRTKGDVLVLQHSDNIRYVNRRRFVRVAVNEPAYVAAFPFARDLSTEEGKKRAGQNDSSENLWGPPRFVRADITELAGPGLRLVAPLEVKIGDRVAIILKLSRAKQDSSQPDFPQNNNSKPSRIIEDIGIVKHTKAIKEGFSIAVELAGLNESNISEMVRATNEASLRKNAVREIRPLSKEKQNKWEYISETVIR